ncbi:hypothetical protein NVP1084O_097 [Vibrio phage 1.084.O._10N.261.49.F5]|nr:hypothetical protein NVP1084O_097 [Vibrio phage 1.084.O._10N.261.49.F5]
MVDKIYVYGENDDLFNDDTIPEHLEVGDTYYRGVQKSIAPKELLRSDTSEFILEMMQEKAYDLAEHVASDCTNMSKEQLKDLQKVIEDWVEDNCEVGFYVAEDVECLVVKPEDVV